MQGKSKSRLKVRGGKAQVLSEVPPPRTDPKTANGNATERRDFFERVWEVVADIPLGKVTTYGHIAEFLGSRSAARTVGWALKAAAQSGLPCHRVVNMNQHLWVPGT